MAVKGPEPLPYTLVAGADLSNAQFAPVALDSTGKAVVANIGSDPWVGVLENKPRSGEFATVQFGPCVTKCRAGLAVSAGNYITPQSGWFIPGQKLQYSLANTGNVMNLGSKTQLAGIALETVASGGVFTAKLFGQLTTINS